MLAPDAESSPCSLFGLGAVPSPSAAYRTPRAVPLFDNEPAPCAEFVPLMVHEVVPPLDCLLPVAEVEIVSQAAKTLPSNRAAGSSHTQHPTHMVLGVPNNHSPASMAHLPPTSAYRPALPPASAHRRQPISPPGKANIVAILKERELDSKK